MRILLLLLVLSCASATDPAFTLVVDTSNTGTSASNQFILPLNSAYTYDFSVDWGDGSGAETVTNATPGFPDITYSYASPGTYSVAITENVVGGFPSISFSNGGDCLKLLQIANWGGVTWSSLNSAFQGCENLTITATDQATANTGNVTDFSYAWYQCSGLTSFPLLDTSSATSLSFAWYYCTGLTSFPLLDTGNVTDFSFAWDRCGALTSFPLLNTSNGTDFSQAWLYCGSLTSFPLLDTSNGTNFTATWGYCNGLTTFPLLDTGNGTNFTYAWEECSNLTGFPLLNTSNGTNFSAAWLDCYGLKSFPLLNTSNGSDFLETWEECIGLTSFPLLDTHNGTDFSAAWYYCTGLTSFPLLNTSNGSDFSNAWQGCWSLTSFPLLNTGNGTNFDYSWYDCTALTSVPLLNLGNMNAGYYCFGGDTLSPASYSALLINLAAVNTNTHVGFNGGNSRYYATAASARNVTLTAGLLWSITDGGQIATPTITSISPNIGPLTAGPQVTITGTGFTGATSVTFGGNAATAVNVGSDSSVTCFPPAGTMGSVNVVVTALAGTVTATGAYSYQATPTIVWGNPTAITYGTILSGTQLNASTSIPGTFVYTPAAGTILGAGGGQTLSVTFTPTDTVDYTAATVTVLLTVNQATPTIVWANPAAITYGTALSATQLNATTNPVVAGTFAYTPAAGTVLTAGAGQTLSVTFTPTDAVDYASVTKTGTLTVNKATSTIVWANPAAITYGTALSATQLNATTSPVVAGTFAYTPAAGTVLTAGAGQTLSVTFTPTDTVDYATVTATVTVTVNQAIPTIVWANPASITYGTALSATQLNATTSPVVAGTFAYTPAAGTVLTAGAGQTLSVTFTPTDTVDYATVTATATVTVTPAPLTITANDLTLVAGTAIPTLTANYTGFVNGDMVASLTTPVTLTTTATTGSGAGTYPIVPSGAVDPNYTITYVDGVLTVTASGSGPAGAPSGSSGGGCGLGNGVVGLVGLLLLGLRLVQLQGGRRPRPR